MSKTLGRDIYTLIAAIGGTALSVLVAGHEIGNLIVGSWLFMSPWQAAALCGLLAILCAAIGATVGAVVYTIIGAIS